MAAPREDRTVAELCTECGGHPNQITQWKSQLKQESSRAFTSGGVAPETVDGGSNAVLGRRCESGPGSWHVTC
jgi:transposase-like protein